MKESKQTTKRNKKPWPTKEAMSQVYALKLWGDNNTAFYSGEGSHHPEIVHPYVEVVRQFLNSFDQPITVCDLGCGDFNVGKRLVESTKKYIAIDIVSDLILYNHQKFKAKNLHFQCLDIAKTILPIGDCVLLRQVLQHLSNTEMQDILPKLYQYKYIILTEHIPEGDFEPNKDIISGQGIRLKKQSGLDLLAPPFNFKVKRREVLLCISSPSHIGNIVTTLYETW